MAYLERRDARIQENATIANDNACLAIQKQGEMVSCLAQLSYVLGQGVIVARANNPAVFMPMRPATDEDPHNVPASAKPQSVNVNDETSNSDIPAEAGQNRQTT